LPLAAAAPPQAEAADAESLCRAGGHTCGRCCWGAAVGRHVLAQRLRRQTRVFAKVVGNRPGRAKLLRYETSIRGGTDLIWAVLLALPVVGDWLRPWLQRRMSCAFLGFEDAGRTRVACLLHPTRWHGRDVRCRAAFALLPGLGCGASDYACLPAWRYRRADRGERQRFLQSAAGLDWHAYSCATERFGP